MTELYPLDRVARAQKAAADADLDALLLTPSADLRYLTGYAALPLERLTCLVVPARGQAALIVPALEHPAAEASPAGRLGIPILPWRRPTTRSPWWRGCSPTRSASARTPWAWPTTCGPSTCCGSAPRCPGPSSGW